MRTSGLRAISVILFVVCAGLALLVQPASGLEVYNLISKWGSYGSGNGQFYTPGGAALDSAGNIYVADVRNHRIQKFDSNGNFLTKWGAAGTGDGQFYYPQDVAVDSFGNVYVADGSDGPNHRIQKFDSNGNFIKKFGSGGSGDGQFSSVRGVAVDSSGNVYVADQMNHRIQKFDSNGNFIKKFGSGGLGDGQFNNPYGVVVDSSGYIYVADRGNNRIQKFDSNSTFITKWGSYGSGDGQFYNPSRVEVDYLGNVYVADTDNHRIQKFDPNGTLITKWGSYGSGDGQFNEIYGLAVKPSCLVYVVDHWNHRIQKFLIDTTYAITTSVAGAGTISCTTPINCGDSSTCTITPGTGYHLESLTDNGADVTASVLGSSYTISNVTATHTIDATFAINTYTLTATAGSGGSISPSGTVTVTYGASQAFTIAPNTGYHIVDVKVDGVSQGHISFYTFTNVAANHTIDATFAINTSPFMEDLVTEYYLDALDRLPEPGGAEWWVAEIERMVSLGIDVKEGFQALARFFFNCDEYALKNKSDVEFVRDLYQTFLNREPDQGGWDFWVSYLQQGLTWNMLITQFAYSDEFRLYMETLFGLGSTRPEDNLVNDLYRGFLNRFPDTGGFGHWVGFMRNAQCQGAQAVRNVTYQIALGFVGSAEYGLRNRSNAEYVEDLYNAILRRGADPAGFTGWVGLLNNGIYTREQFLPFFTNSAEFQFRVDEMISAGCLP